MKIIRAKDYDDVSRKAASILAAQIILKPDAVLGLATGGSPVGLYRHLVDGYQRGALDFSGIRAINLDEYVGLGADHEQSYAFFMRRNLFDHVNIAPENCHIPNGLTEDPEQECAAYDALIQAMGGTDLQLLGMGANGHIGFNEPGDVFIPETHCVALKESTIEANARFFTGLEEVPKKAYTMGIRGIMQAKRIVMVVSGSGKAQAVKQAFWGPITPALPASILQLHPDFTLVADDAALSLIPESV